MGRGTMKRDIEITKIEGDTTETTRTMMTPVTMLIMIEC